MSFSFGNRIRITLFGQSHGDAIGVVMDGIPAGFEIDMEKVTDFMSRRKPGQSHTSPRCEYDRPEIVSGIFEGKTCGAPLCAVFRNEDVNDNDYEKTKNTPRPGHGDYTAFIKYGGFNDYRGGGALSGRITCPMCFAGAVLIQLLEKSGIRISSELISVGGKTGDSIGKEIEKAEQNGDSLSGEIRCTVDGIPTGYGSPLFDSVESVVSHAVFSVPGVKGIEFGSTCCLGSENNDEYRSDKGRIYTETNNHGGVLGGITSGMPIVFTCKLKPTPSIRKEQKTVNLETGENTVISVCGRHDPCFALRAAPCIEAATAIAVADLVLEDADGHI